MKKTATMKVAEYVIGMLCTYLGQKREGEACALEDEASRKRREGMTLTMMGHQFLQRAGFEVRTFDPLDDEPEEPEGDPLH